MPMHVFSTLIRFVIFCVFNFIYFSSRVYSSDVSVDDQDLSSNNGRPCPIVFGPKKFKDGVYECPNFSDQSGPFQLMQCTLNYTRDSQFFHTPTSDEILKMNLLIQYFKNKKISKMLDVANEFNYQVCRKVDTAQNDSWLLFIGKNEKLSTFLAPMLMLREKNANQLILQSPHDGRDGIDFSSKMLFAQTHALAMISNSFPRGITSKIQSGCGEGEIIGDMSHSTLNLGYVAFKALMDHYPESKLIHMHGQSYPGIIFTDGTSKKASVDSFIYQFALALEDAYNSLKPDILLNSIKSCSRGTVFGGDGKCQLTEAWVEGRYLTGATNPLCQTGGKMQNNQFIGIEFGKNVKYAQFMVEIIRYLEIHYLHTLIN